MVTKPTIPQALMPPTKPPTVAEMRRIREPPPAPLTPEQQAKVTEYRTQLAEHEQNISNVKTALEKTQAELSQMQKAYAEYTQIKSAKFITIHLSRESGLQKQITTLKQMLGKLQQGFLISSTEAIAYSKSLGETTRRESVRAEEYAKRLRQYREVQKLKKVTPIEVKDDPIFKYQYETYKRGGFTETEATILARESIKQQMTFTSKRAREILRQKEITPTTAIVGYDWMGQPQYVSVAPEMLTPRERALQKRGLPITDRVVEKLAVISPIFDVSTISGRVKEIFITKVTPFEPLARGIKAFEERRITRAEWTKAEAEVSAFEKKYQKEKLPGEIRSEFAKRKKPKWYAGGSFLQAYLELYGVEFYAPGEREVLMQEEVEKQDPIYTQKYQDAFEKKYLKDIQEGKINYEQAVGEFMVSKEVRDIEKDYETKIGMVAPTSAWGNVLVQLADFYAKFAFFAPLIKTAAAKKTKQELVQKKKMSQKRALKKYIETIEEARLKVPKSKIRESYAKILKTGDRARIESAEKVIRDWFPPTKKGLEDANRFIRDVQTQEGYVSYAPTGRIPEMRLGMERVEFGMPKMGVFEGRIPTEVLAPPKPTVIFDITEAAVAPGLERLAEFALVAFPFDKEREKLKEFTIARPLLPEKEIVKEKVKVRLVEPTASALLTGQTLIQPQVEALALVQPQLLRPRLAEPTVTVTGFRVPEITRPRVPKKPKIPKVPPIVIPFLFPGEPYRKATRTGYHTFVKSKGKYQKVTTKPMMREGAKDIGARITDHTLSAQFKIEPIKQTKIVKGKKQLVPKRFREEELGRGDNYFKQTAHKFRNFMIRRGKKLLMEDKWIEKRGKRSDTLGEQQGLTVAAFMARERKRRVGLPVRRTKRKPKEGVGKYFGI